MDTKNQAVNQAVADFDRELEETLNKSRKPVEEAPKPKHQYLGRQSMAVSASERRIYTDVCNMKLGVTDYLGYDIPEEIAVVVAVLLTQIFSSLDWAGRWGERQFWTMAVHPRNWIKNHPNPRRIIEAVAEKVSVYNSVKERLNKRV